MENKLEQLLNSLIEKGRKPYGEDRIDKINWLEQYVGNWNWGCWSEKNSYWRWKSTRQIVSKESGLWQFVCENKMEKKMEKNHRGIWINSWHKDAYESYPVYTMEKYEYWILESALKDESELEEFLLSNIKVEGEIKGLNYTIEKLKEENQTLELWLDNKEKLNEKYRKQLDGYKM